VERVARDLGLALPPSTSHTTPLLGAGERPLLDLPEAVARHLYETYGTLAGEVLALGERPLLPGLPYLEGEVVWAVRRELARKPMDVLARRLGLAFLDQDKALSTLPRVVAFMAALLGRGAEGAGVRGGQEGPAGALLALLGPLLTQVATYPLGQKK
jgi:glycerol-3-phosphate dehydrogenase